MVIEESEMKLRIGKMAGMVILVGLAGCRSARVVDSGPMDMLQDSGVANVSRVDHAALRSLVGREVKVSGNAVDTKFLGTGVKAEDGRIWYVQIRTLGAWPADIVGRRVHVKGVLRVWTQRLDAAGRPVNERGEIVQGFSMTEEVYYLADCVYERG
jgi:hypothetical protein